jgi:hypothetical protein
VTYLYDRQTKTFGEYNLDGTTRTFFNIGDPCHEAKVNVFVALSADMRGLVIEDTLASTEYKDWEHKGALHGGTYPVFDFEKPQVDTWASLKTVYTKGSTWKKRMRETIRELGRTGKSAILDIRVQPGGVEDARPLIEYGAKHGVTVTVKECG